MGLGFAKGRRCITSHPFDITPKWRLFLIGYLIGYGRVTFKLSVKNPGESSLICSHDNPRMNRCGRCYIEFVFIGPLVSTYSSQNHVPQSIRADIITDTASGPTRTTNHNPALHCACQAESSQVPTCTLPLKKYLEARRDRPPQGLWARRRAAITAASKRKALIAGARCPARLHSRRSSRCSQQAQ